MVHDPNAPTCRSINEVLQRVGDKWSVLIVSVLSQSSKRFSELRREIPTISQRMLTLTLRGLERDGLVNRKVTATVPPRVDYTLTPLGESLCGPICALATWATGNIDAIRAAQELYDDQLEELNAA